MDCINLAQDRDKRTSVDNAIVNLLSFIEWGGGEFLDYLRNF